MEQYPGSHYQKLFDHLLHNHGLTLLTSEMFDIVQVVKELEQPSPSPVEVDKNIADLVIKLEENIRSHMNPYNLGDEGETTKQINQLIRFVKNAPPPASSGESMRWVKGAPVVRKLHHAKIKSKMNPDVVLNAIITPSKSADYWWAAGDEFNFTVRDVEIVAHLGETASPSDTREKAIKFAEWAGNDWIWNGDEWTQRGAHIDPLRISSVRLYDLYTQSLNK